jgi:8-oxo-dGTP pyrophosphatase MutT (NUDIX family)
MNNSGIINVFQPGLERGSEVSEYARKMGYGPNKRYFYVETPGYENDKKSGFRVFMRACCFIHLKGERNPSKFVVVKDTTLATNAKAWEPPKGQTEGKDGLKDKSIPLLKVLQENLRREVYEEAKIEENALQKLHHTGLVLQSSESDYPENTFFQYHIFQAFIEPEDFEKAREKFLWYKEHPKAWERLRKDHREKNEIGWFDPKTTKLQGKWSPAIVSLYLNNFS